MKRAEFKCKADAAEVWLYDSIGESWDGGISAAAFIEDLQDVGTKPLTVRINSGGGDVFDSLAIYNALRRHPAAVTTAIDGIAASAASIVAMAGQSIRMAENAFMMIHKSETITWGNSDEHAKAIRLLDSVNDTMIATYSKRSGRPEAAFQDYFNSGDTWFGASDAIDVGLVDAMSETLQVAAKLDTRRYAELPERVAARITDTPIPDPTPQPARWRLAYAERVLTMIN